MKLRQLEYLLETHNQKLNMSEAARALNTTQPAISSAIRMLERELGVDLLTRQGKRLGMTPAGVQVVSLARETLQSVESIRRAAAEFQSETTGPLRIATTHTQARYVLPIHIREFRKRFPNVSLHISQGTPEFLAELTVKGDVDFAIATEGFEHFSNLILAPCYLWNRAVVVPKGHALSCIDHLTLNDIASYPLVTYVFGFTQSSSVAKAFSDANIDANVAFTATDTDVIKKYVREGLGVGLIASMAREPNTDNDLEFLDASHLFEPSVTQIALRKGVFLRSYMYNFIESFAKHLTSELIDSALTSSTRVEQEQLLSGFDLPTL